MQHGDDECTFANDSECEVVKLVPSRHSQNAYHKFPSYCKILFSKRYFHYKMKIFLYDDCFFFLACCKSLL